jgi:hypothetical protein
VTSPRAEDASALSQTLDTEKAGGKLKSELRRARRLALRTALVSTLALPVALFAGAHPVGAASSNGLTVKASEYVYKLSGSPKSGWTQITFDNVGTEYHMMAVQPLKKGVTKQQLKAAIVANDDKAFAKIAGKGQVAGVPQFLSPGQKTAVVTKLAAGHYGILCFIPAPDGSPHVAHGMFTVFDVSSAKSGMKPPKDGVVDVTLTDQAVTLPSSGLPAHGWAKVDNTSSVSRDLTLARFATGATFDQANTYFNTFFESGKPPAGDAPATIAAGVSGVPSGGLAYLELDLDKGNWAAVSGNEEAQNDHTWTLDFAPRAFAVDDAGVFPLLVYTSELGVALLGLLAPSPVGGGSRGVAVGAGAVWVALESDQLGKFVGGGSGSLGQVSSYPLGNGADAVLFDTDRVYVTNRVGRSVSIVRV